MLRQTMTDESAFQRNESKEETREHEEGSVRAVTYAFRLLNRMTRYLITNYAMYATSYSVIYVTPTCNISTSVTIIFRRNKLNNILLLIILKNRNSYINLERTKQNKINSIRYAHMCVCTKLI